MKGFEIRAMTATDVDAAVALGRAQGWRDRRRFYEFVLRTSTCLPLVGVVEGRVVATAVGTMSRPIGWIGAIVVEEGLRRRGLGRAMTETICDALRAAGCATLSLESTDSGRPLYEHMGFRFATCYHQLQADHLPEPPAMRRRSSRSWPYPGRAASALPPRRSRRSTRSAGSSFRRPWPRLVHRRCQPAADTSMSAARTRRTAADRASPGRDRALPPRPRRSRSLPGSRELSPASHLPSAAKAETVPRRGPGWATRTDGAWKEHPDSWPEPA